MAIWTFWVLVIRVWILFRPSVLAGFLGHCCNRSGGTASLQPGRGTRTPPGSLLSFHGHQRMGDSWLLLGGGKSSSSPLGCYGYLPGWRWHGHLFTAPDTASTDTIAEAQPPYQRAAMKVWVSTRLPPTPPPHGFGVPHYSLARGGTSKLPTWPFWQGGCGATTFSVVFGWSTVVSAYKFSFS